MDKIPQCPYCKSENLRLTDHHSLEVVKDKDAEGLKLDNQIFAEGVCDNCTRYVVLRGTISWEARTQ